MKKVAIITDSASQITADVRKRYCIEMLPLQISDEDNNYLESIDINEQEVCELMTKGKIMKTSLPRASDIVDMLEKLKHDYDEVIAITIASGISSTGDVISSLASDSELKVTVIDSKAASSQQTYFAVSTRRLLEKGKNAKEIKDILEDIANRSATFLIPDDLTNFKRSGRLTTSAYVVSNLLKIKPILYMNNTLGGKVDVMGKVRTLNKACEVVIDNIVENGVNAIDHFITVANSINEKVAKEVVDKIKEKLGDIKIITRPIPSTVACHTGNGCIAIQYVPYIKQLSKELDVL